MKFVYKASTLGGANEIKALLDNAGIPASVSNSNFASLNLFFIPHSPGVFIYNSSQYQDAIALLNNHDHIVSNPIDTEEFYNSLNSEQATKDAYMAMNNFIFGMVVFGLICGLLIYVLS
jgi:hypothetical protein